MLLTAETSWRYLLTQSDVILRYLRLAFVPSPLIFLYSWPLVTSISDVFVSALVIGLLLALTVAGLVKRQPLAYAGAWFFVILAPTSSVIPIVTEVAAEHRMYLPLMGIIAAVVCVAFVLVRRLDPRAASPSVVAGAAIVAILLGAQTRARNEVYASELRIWQDTVTRDPGNQRAHLAYATALGINGRVADAEAEFQRAVDLAETDPIAQARLGSAQAAQGKFDAGRTAPAACR